MDIDHDSVTWNCGYLLLLAMKFIIEPGSPLPVFKKSGNIPDGRLKMIRQPDHHLMPVEVKDGFAGGNGGWSELLGF